jgi:arylsulfatase A-like enzyme
MGVGFEHTLPGELAKAGYHTQGVGKMHFFPQRALNGFHNLVLDESGRSEDPGFVSDYREWFNKNKTGDYDFSDHGINWNSWMARPFHAPEFLHPTNWTLNEAIKFLDHRESTAPFFLKVSFARPHSPYDAIQSYFDMYLRKDIPEAAVGDWAEMHNVPRDAGESPVSGVNICMANTVPVIPRSRRCSSSPTENINLSGSQDWGRSNSLT